MFAVAGCLAAAWTTTLSQRKQTITRRLSDTSMTSRKLSPLTTGNFWQPGLVFAQNKQ